MKPAQQAFTAVASSIAEETQVIMCARADQITNGRVVYPLLDTRHDDAVKS